VQCTCNALMHSSVLSSGIRHMTVFYNNSWTHPALFPLGLSQTLFVREFEYLKQGTQLSQGTHYVSSHLVPNEYTNGDTTCDTKTFRGTTPSWFLKQLVRVQQVFYSTSTEAYYSIKDYTINLCTICFKQHFGA